MDIPYFTAIVHPWQCDAMGHLNTRFYAAIFDDASFQLLQSFISPTSDGMGWADVAWTLSYKHEIRSGTILRVTSHIVSMGTKSVTFRHAMKTPEGDAVLADAEIKAVRFDLVNRRSIPLEEGVRERLRGHVEASVTPA